MLSLFAAQLLIYCSLAFLCLSLLNGISLLLLYINIYVQYLFNYVFILNAVVTGEARYITFWGERFTGCNRLRVCYR